MPISIYDYENSKIPFSIELDREILKHIKKDTYFFDCDWQEGPNLMIVLLEH